MQARLLSGLRLYLIDLSFLGRYSFLRLLLKDLLPLLYVVFRCGGERVVELIIAFIHHVPVSVCLLQNHKMIRNIN